MTSRRASFAVAALLATTSSALAQGEVGDLARKLDGQFAKSYPADGPGAAVVLTRAGEVLFRRAYGKASLELDVDLDAGHAFCVASITKPFTAIAIMALVEDGKLELDDAADEHLPDLRIDDRITVAHLLSHTSGLPDFSELPTHDDSRIHAAIGAQELCRAADQSEPAFPPGSEFRYTNVNYALLGRIVETASGESWEQFLQRRVFEPAGMKHTRYGAHDRVVPGLVRSYTHDGNGWRRARFLSMTRRLRTRRPGQHR